MCCGIYVKKMKKSAEIYKERCELMENHSMFFSALITHIIDIDIYIYRYISSFINYLFHL